MTQCTIESTVEDLSFEASRCQVFSIQVSNATFCRLRTRPCVSQSCPLATVDRLERFTMHILPLLLLCFAGLSAAQFQFFEQMFSGGGHQHHGQQQQQEKQNVASDSEWYQRTYDGGMHTLYFTSYSSILLFL